MPKILIVERCHPFDCKHCKGNGGGGFDCKLSDGFIGDYLPDEGVFPKWCELQTVVDADGVIYIAARSGLMKHVRDIVDENPSVYDSVEQFVHQAVIQKLVPHMPTIVRGEGFESDAWKE